MSYTQLKGESNWIKNWPTLIPTCCSGCLCQFLTSQKLKQHCGITFPRKANPKARTTREERETQSCMHQRPQCQPSSCPSGHPYAKLVANREASARTLVVLGYDTWTSSVGGNICLCTKTHTLSGVGIQWRRQFQGGVCIVLGIGWHLGTHTILFAFAQRLVWGKVFDWGERSPFPGARKGWKG